MSKVVKNIISYCLRILGLRLQRITSVNTNANSYSIKDNGLRDCLYLLKSLGFTPKRIFDIGAHKGGWTRIVREYFPESNYTLFEPQERLIQHVQDLIANEKVELINKGVGNKDEIRKFTLVGREDSCNFLFTESQAEENSFEQINIEVITLDSFIKSQNGSVPELLKIDAEGLDLEVLKGARTLLGITEVIMIEVGVLNRNIPNNIGLVINYMNENGYELFDVTELNRPFEVKLLWLMELVFILKTGEVFKSVKSL